jgi:hypothetical protein
MPSGGARPNCKPQAGEKNGAAKLTKEAVATMRLLYEEGSTLQTLAKRYGVCVATVWFAINHVTWKSLT